MRAFVNTCRQAVISIVNSDLFVGNSLDPGIQSFTFPFPPRNKKNDTVKNENPNQILIS